MGETRGGVMSETILLAMDAAHPVGAAVEVTVR